MNRWLLSLLVFATFMPCFYATQLAVIRIPDGLLVAANEAETAVSPDGKEHKIGNICKILHDGKTVVLVIGAQGFLSKGKVHGSVIKALSIALAQGVPFTFSSRESTLEMAIEEAFREQVAAKKKGYPLGVPLSMRTIQSSFILASYENDQLETSFVTVKLNDWDKQTFTTHAWPFDLNKTNLVQWYQVTPVGFSAPKLPSLASETEFLTSRMNIVYTSIPEPSHARMEPPFVIGKLTQAGFSWISNSKQCQLSP